MMECIKRTWAHKYKMVSSISATTPKSLMLCFYWNDPFISCAPNIHLLCIILPGHGWVGSRQQVFTPVSAKCVT